MKYKPTKLTEKQLELIGDVIGRIAACEEEDCLMDEDGEFAFEVINEEEYKYLIFDEIIEMIIQADLYLMPEQLEGIQEIALKNKWIQKI